MDFFFGLKVLFLHPMAGSGIWNWTKELNEKVTIPFFFWSRYFFLKGIELSEVQGEI